jgi:soluble lytic murein transglycosylase-like protein
VVIAIAAIVLIFLLSRKNGSQDSGLILVSYTDTIEKVLSFAANVVQVSNIKLIDPALICAIIAVESEGNPDAKRPVANPKYYGLMQISFETAQWRGYKGDRNGLFDPDINIFFGADYLSYQITRYKSYIFAVSAYKVGNVTFDKSGQPINPALEYIDSVGKFYLSFREFFISGYDGYKQAYPDKWTA